jgi:hypothetical protein
MIQTIYQAAYSKHSGSLAGIKYQAVYSKLEGSQFLRIEVSLSILGCWCFQKHKLEDTLLVLGSPVGS